MARAKEFDEDEILEKAVALFSCKGYNGTSAQDLVDGLGISRSSMYDTFGDKRTLFIKAINKYRERNSAEMIQFIENSDDVVKTVKHIFNAALNDILKDDLYKGCLIVNSTVEMAAQDPEIAAILNENMSAVEDVLYRAIKKGQANGQVSKANSARALARFFFNTLSGLRVASKAGADRHVYDDIIKVALSTLK